MRIEEIIQAWKSPLYRKQLGSEELAALPANPVGEVELSEAELSQIHGGELGTVSVCNTVGHCTFTSQPDDGDCLTAGCPKPPVDTGPEPNVTFEAPCRG